MTAQVYQIRDYQPTETKMRVIERQMAEITRELVDFCTGVGSDTSPCERNPEDCA